MKISITNLMVVICLCKNHECSLSWTIEKKVSQYGDELSLFCPVQKCCSESAGWVIWSSEVDYTTLFIDVKDLDIHADSKYNGKTNKTGIFLFIRNITRDDLNTTYSCTYGFQVGTKKILLDSDAFIDKLKEQCSRESELQEKTEDDSSKESKHVIPTDYAIALSLLAAFVVVVVIIAVVIILYFKNKNNTEMAHSEDASEGINRLLSMNVGPVQTGRNPMNLDDDCPTCNPETQLSDTDEKASPPKTFLNLRSSIGNKSNYSEDSFKSCFRDV
ncbi:uncharacterized protein [Mytilus edulis]|uniref:uncharacterized protein n=1 Tax=Mytilus edulis TaxID=6550 RepID=UPI0039F14224